MYKEFKLAKIDLTKYFSNCVFFSDFGERFSHLPSRPMPTELKDYDNLVTSMKKFLSDNPIDDTVPEDKLSKYHLQKIHTVNANREKLQFLESLPN